MAPCQIARMKSHRLWHCGNRWGCAVSLAWGVQPWNSRRSYRWICIEMTKAGKVLADLEGVFGALAHASRRQILLVLWLRGGALSAGQIADRFSCKWPTVSRHLSLLISAGLVQVRKEGRERFYTLDRDRLMNVAGGWLRWFETKAQETNAHETN